MQPLTGPHPQPLPSSCANSALDHDALLLMANLGGADRAALEVSRLSDAYREELHIPQRVLAGLLPSAILEHFVVWELCGLQDGGGVSRACIGVRPRAAQLTRTHTKSLQPNHSHPSTAP